MKKSAEEQVACEFHNSAIVILRWSDVLESAFDYYYSEYLPAWALNKTPFNNVGDKVFIWKKDKGWVSWERIASPERPDIGTLFDLLPDLPKDDEYWKIIHELEGSGIKNAEDYFWENVFSYKHANEIEVNGRIYKIEWES